MKKLLFVLLALAALSALCVPALAAEKDADGKTQEKGPAIVEKAPAFVRMWGKVSPWEGEGIYLKNDSGDGSLDQVVVHVGEKTPAVDASTGLPLDLKKVKEGDTLYVWTGPAMALSMPPQVSALVVVGNVPADAAAPEFCEIAKHIWRFASEDHKNPVFSLTGGEKLEVTDKTVYTPWLTKQMVRADDLVPGTRVLVWKDKDGAAEKIQLLPYGYRGYMTSDAMPHGDMLVCVFAEKEIQELPYKTVKDGGLLVPIRAVAEAAGYSVSWDKNRGAVVYDENTEVVFYVWPGDDVVWTKELGEMPLSAPCLKEGGTTYLPIEDLCRYLNLYLSLG